MKQIRQFLCGAFLVLLTLVSSVSYAQFETLKNNLGIPLREKSYVDIEGSPYLYPNWSTGSVTLEDGRTIEGTRVKYNIHEDELDMIYNNSPIAVHKNEIKAFTLQETTADGKNKTYVFHKVNVDGEMKYMEALYEGSVTYYKLHRRTVEAPQHNTYSASSYNTKRFITSEKHYLLTDGGLQELRPRVNNLTKLLPEKKDRIKELTKGKAAEYNSEMGIALLLSMLEG